VKVLLAAHHVPPRHVSGTEVYTDRLAAQLAKRHEVTVFAADDDPRLAPGSIRRRKGPGFEIVEIADPRLARRPEDSWTSPAAEAAFRGLLAEKKPDVCHFQHLRYLGLSLPAVARASGAATLMTVHDYWLLCARDGQLIDREGARCDGPGLEKCACCLEGFRFGLGAGEARAARAVARVSDALGVDLGGVARRAGLALRRFAHKSRQAAVLPQHPPAGILTIVEARREAVRTVASNVDLFISPSQFLRGVFQDAGFGGRWKVIGHGVDRPRERPDPPERPDGPLRIGFAGTVTPLKGVDLLIQAVQQLPRDSYRLDIHGRDDQRPEYVTPLKRAARGLPIQFHGAYEPGDAPRFLRDQDVAVVPSRWVENQPLAILEAFAWGVPVVASALGGMSELVEDGRNGRLFPVGSAGGLAKALSELASDRSQLGALKHGIVPPPTMEEHTARIEASYVEVRKPG
jgi:glycosyltransferase involved in cell wall biosynthesis